MPAWFGPVVAGILLLFGTYLTVRASRSGQKIDQATKNYDQLQEDLTATRTELRNVKADMATMKRDHDTQMAGVRAREQAVEDYAYQLRQWIQEQKGPPPPEWPKELFR